MKTITRGQYLQLLGLQTLAKQHWSAINDIEKAALEITKEDNDIGHTMDMMADSRNIDDGLRILGIKVEESNNLASEIIAKFENVDKKFTESAKALASVLGSSVEEASKTLAETIKAFKK
jgi:hypothetical protein